MSLWSPASCVSFFCISSVFGDTSVSVKLVKQGLTYEIVISNGICHRFPFLLHIYVTQEDKKVYCIPNVDCKNDLWRNGKRVFELSMSSYSCVLVFRLSLFVTQVSMVIQATEFLTLLTTALKVRMNEGLQQKVSLFQSVLVPVILSAVYTLCYRTQSRMRHTSLFSLSHWLWFCCRLKSVSSSLILSWIKWVSKIRKYNSCTTRQHQHKHSFLQFLHTFPGQWMTTRLCYWCIGNGNDSFVRWRCLQLDITWTAYLSLLFLPSRV
jgi:hypothetical protein